MVSEVFRPRGIFPQHARLVVGDTMLVKDCAQVKTYRSLLSLADEVLRSVGYDGEESLGALIERFRRATKGLYEDTTSERQHYTLVAMERRLGRDTPLRSLTPEGVQAALDTYSHDARRGVGWIWCRLFNWGHKNGCAGLAVLCPSYPRAKKNDEYLPPRECTKAWLAVLQAYAERTPSGKTASALAMATFTGLRPIEVCRLEWSHIDWDRGMVRVERGKEPRESALGQIGRQILEVQPKVSRWVFPCRQTRATTFKHGHMCRETLTSAARSIFDGVGLANWKLKTLRAAMSTVLVRLGITPFVLQNVLGHTSLAMLHRHYVSMGREDAQLALFAAESTLTRALPEVARVEVGRRVSAETRLMLPEPKMGRIKPLRRRRRKIVACR